ncbi:MAG: monofunctional biosynthetic peptidoglycan transglycosylase [Chlamydiota bacterium]
MNFIGYLRDIRCLKEGYRKTLFFCRKLAKAILVIFIFIMIVLHGLLLTYKWVNPPLTNMMLVHWWQSGREMPLHFLKKHWIPLQDISPYIKIAVLNSEDRYFFKHKGFCMKSMIYALKQDFIHHNKVSSSTITQQTAKNIFLFPRQSYLRKLLELYFAVILEIIWGKDRILEVYLNVFELGYGVYGIENGTQHHFSKPASRLCFDEACLLAAILYYPKTLNPLNPTNYVYYKASCAFKRGLSTAKKQHTNFPYLSGKCGLQ